MIPPIHLTQAISDLIRLGLAIRERYKIYTHAKGDLSELDARLRASLLVLEVFQKVIRQGLDSLLYRQQQDIAFLIDRLQGFFDRLENQLSRFPRDAKLDIVGKLRWTFQGKSGHDAILREIADWRSEMHDVVAAIKFLQENEREGDRSLYKQLFRDCGGVGIHCADKMGDVLRGRGNSLDLRAIDDALLSSLKASGNLKDGNPLILQHHLTYVECRHLEERHPDDVKRAIANIDELASVLQQVDTASMHILRCKGTIPRDDIPKRCLLFYEIPGKPMSKTKWSLAQLIRDEGTPKPSLNTRVRYAVEISMAVMFTHAAGLVHKSIMPQNVLILRNSPANSDRHTFSAYLAGFDTARLGDMSARTIQAPVTDPVRSLHQHPDRQIPDVYGKVVRFGIRHDMYSLGVVLLELAMWCCIEDIGDRELNELRKAGDPYKLQARLVKLADRFLTGRMGRKYAGAVLCCLQDSITKKKEREMRELFYERVLQPLKQIVL